MDNGIIPYANEISYSPNIDGHYNVEVFFLSGCPTISNSYNFIIDLGVLEKFIPINHAIYQNYPNPFNAKTTLRYDLPKDVFVSIRIYDMLGNIVSNLKNRKESAGYQSVQWDATNSQGQTLSAGVYFYSIEAGDFRQTKKMVLLK